MRFVNPQFLYALFAVIIPVIIHLFNFQKHKTVVFSNVTFLNEVKKSTRAKTTIKEWLILISRVLTIAALVIAFAQPYLSQKDQVTESDVHSVYVDNSFSSLAQLNGTSIIDHHKSMALAVLKELPKHKSAQLLTNNFKPSEQFLYRPEKLIKQLNSLEISGQKKNLRQISARQEQAFEGEVIHSYIISDFQKSQFPELLDNLDTGSLYYLIPTSPNRNNNLSLDSVWFTSPVKSQNTFQKIHFSVSNHGSDTAFNKKVSVMLNNTVTKQLSLSIPPKSSLDSIIIVRNPQVGWVKGEINIDDSFNPIDNNLFFSYLVDSSLNVLEIHDQQTNKAYAEIFSKEPYFNFESKEITKLSQQQIQAANLIILNLTSAPSNAFIIWLSDFVRNGGSVSINPIKINKSNEIYGALLSELNVSLFSNLISDTVAISTINTKTNVYEGVLAPNQPKTISYPKVYQYFYENKLPTNAKSLLSFNKANLAIDFMVDKGHLYKFNFAIDSQHSDFINHKLFLPTFFQFAFVSKKSNKLYHFTTTAQIELTLPFSKELTEIKSIDTSFAFAPQVVPNKNISKIYLHNQINQTGHYGIWQGNKLVTLIAINYPRSESSSEYFSVQELNNLKDSLNIKNVSILKGVFDEIGAQITKSQQGINLWQFFIGLALLFLLVEIILIRYFKPGVI